MTTSERTPPAPFTSEDYAARMRRVVADAADAGLDGLLVTPGPDLVWLTGYQPTAITERLTVLVLRPGPGADAAGADPGAARRRGGRRRARPHDRRLGRRRGPVRAARAPLIPSGATMGISDSAWAMHLLGPAGRAARILVPLADREPAHAPRGQGRQRAGPAGGRGRRRGRDVRARSSASGSPAGRRPTSPPTWRGCCASSGTSRSTSPSSAPARTAPTRTTRPATATSRSATRSCSTSAA